MESALLFLMLFNVLAQAPIAMKVGGSALREIADKPHSPILKAEALRIFPSGRKYTLLTRYEIPGNPAPPRQDTADEKWVDGKYVISEMTDDEGKKYQQVICYDEKTALYRQYDLYDGDLVRIASGSREGDSRGMKWHDVWIGSGLQTPFVGIATGLNTDESVTWHTVFYRDDTPLGAQDMTCTVTQRDFVIAELSRQGGATELTVGVNCGKAEEYLTSEFAAYRDEKRLCTFKTQRAANGKLIFKIDDAKSETHLVKSDTIVQIQ